MALSKSSARKKTGYADDKPKKGGELYPAEACHNGPKSIITPLKNRFPGNGPRPVSTYLRKGR